MHTLSLFLGLLASVIPSLAAPTPSVPLYNYAGSVPDPTRYIVKVKDGIDTLSILGLLGSLTSPNTVTQQYNSDFYNAFAGNFDQDSVDTFMSSPNVEYVAQDGVMTTSTASTSVTQTNAGWNLARISTRKKLADQNPFDLNYKFNYTGSAPGSGVDIYIVDTGINIAHVDFEGRARWGKTFCAGCADADGDGHGTHVSGTAAGKRFGVAKAANLIAVKVLDDQGSGYISDIIAGLQWVRDQQQISGRPSIASMSLGGSSSQPLIDAVTGLINAGIHCTVAAGNSNVDAKDTSPANTPRAITVGATDITDTRAFYSNFGPAVTIFAPGSNVTSDWIGSTTAVNTISGTSMATPLVAGLVAYLLDINIMGPKATPDFMRAYLQSQATLFALNDIPLNPPTLNLLAFNDYNGQW